MRRALNASRAPPPLRAFRSWSTSPLSAPTRTAPLPMRAARRAAKRRRAATWRERLARWGTELAEVVVVAQEVEAIQEASARLADQVDLLIVAGQTSIMDEDDITPRGLEAAGATLELHGAPVEPGNLLALAYFPRTPVMCAPGCARSVSHNVVDMVLPRLLTGERLGRAEIAELGVGGLL